MKSKPSVFSLVLLLAAITATASPAAHDVTAAAKPEHISATESSCPAAGHERPTRDTRRDESYVGWRRLIPTRLTVQFAGGMGMFSAGIGWEYGRRGQWATDLFAGFIPASAIGRTYPTTTAKQSYTPWSIRCCRERLSVEPLTCGMYINSVIADEFWLREPSRYPKGYYGFSTKLRAHLFVGQSYRFHLRGGGVLRDISLFWEMNTCDLYLISRITNRYMDFGDYVGLSVGIGLHLFGGR